MPGTHGTAAVGPGAAAPAAPEATLPFTGSGDALPVTGFVLLGLGALGLSVARRRRAARTTE